MEAEMHRTFKPGFCEEAPNGHRPLRPGRRGILGFTELLRHKTLRALAPHGDAARLDGPARRKAAEGSMHCTKHHKSGGDLDALGCRLKGCNNRAMTCASPTRTSARHCHQRCFQRECQSRGQDDLQFRQLPTQIHRRYA